MRRSPALLSDQILIWRNVLCAGGHNHHTTSDLIGTPKLADYLERALTQFDKLYEDFEEHL
jgi:hypothetical protein